LGALESLELPFRAPRPIAIMPDPHGPALVETAVAGVLLDFRPGRNHPRPWELVAQVAAAVHRAPVEPCEPVLPPAASRREHAESMLGVLAGLDRPELRDAAQWIGENMPSEQPATLVHGDLLGQNVLLCADEPPGLIDWERAGFGDPAADLAVVTRGSRRPFKNPRGLDRLLDAYADAGGTAVTAREVRLYEILMVAGWYREALAGGSAHVGPPDGLARQVARLVASADASTS
ncbi:MAG: phosphotransferase family protein, partial [Polyangiales bacterium]